MSIYTFGAIVLAMKHDEEGRDGAADADLPELDHDQFELMKLSHGLPNANALQTVSAGQSCSMSCDAVNTSPGIRVRGLDSSNIKDFRTLNQVIFPVKYSVRDAARCKAEIKT